MTASSGSMSLRTSTSSPFRGRLGVIIHFQNTLPLGDDLANYERFYRQGLRMVQICYNRTNLVGDGCLEPGDGPDKLVWPGE